MTLDGVADAYLEEIESQMSNSERDAFHQSGEEALAFDELMTELRIREIVKEMGLETESDTLAVHILAHSLEIGFTFHGVSLAPNPLLALELFVINQETTEIERIINDLRSSEKKEVLFTVMKIFSDRSCRKFERNCLQLFVNSVLIGCPFSCELSVSSPRLGYGLLGRVSMSTESLCDRVGAYVYDQNASVVAVPSKEMLSSLISGQMMGGVPHVSDEIEVHIEKVSY